MPRFVALVSQLVRATCALLVGAQLFFSAVAAQVVFPHAVAALPHGDPRRTLAADLVGQMLARLDAWTLLGCGLAVLLTILLARAGAVSRRAALAPLLAALLAFVSSDWVTPAIQAMRAAGRTGEPSFGRLHAISALLLLAEMLLLAWGALRPAAVDSTGSKR